MTLTYSIWASVTNWFTPTLLFCFLNLIIGITIFISSSFKNHEHGSEGTTSPQLLLIRPPSLLERMKSINFSFRRSDQPYPFPSVAQYVDPAHKAHYQNHEQYGSNESEEEEVTTSSSQLLRLRMKSTAQYVDSADDENHPIMRSQSEPSVEVPTITKREKRKMKRSASEKVKVKEESDEVVDRRRPSTVRERKEEEEDEAVDRKADDFINRFREQLKLQRLNSILRYKEMIDRGAGK